MTESSSQSRRSFGDYDLVRELGRGGMGIVYEAHERALDRRVALKVLPKELAHDATYAQRFLNEARAAARLNHPNIVTIHAVGQVNDRHYIAMELVEGVSLSAWVKRHGPMDAQQALGLVRQVAEALAEAHRRGIIHRDIKPQNIMVDETGRVKVLDFGLAKVLESASELTAQGSQLGTPRYMAPEQIQGKQVDARSDIYSLGVVLYELLAGRVAIEGDSPMTVMYKIVHEPFPDIAQARPGIPLPVVQLLQKMTAREPERRPQTAPELIQVIDGARAGRVLFDNILRQPGAPHFGGQQDAPLLDDRLRTEITGISLAPALQQHKLTREFPYKQVGIAVIIAISGVILSYPVYKTVSRAESRREPRLLSVAKIWDRGAHNAFTDIIRFNDRWYCTFREAEGHTKGDGSIRVISSENAVNWESCGQIVEEGVDLRDPKISITPDNRLMIVMVGSVYRNNDLLSRQTRVSFSEEGQDWSLPRRILTEGDCLWRVTWKDGVAYGASYNVYSGNSKDWRLTLYKGMNGVDFEALTEFEIPERPNETTLRFLPDDSMLAIVRREAGSKRGWLGTSKSPYTKWSWTEISSQVGGPNFVCLPDGSLWGAARDYSSGTQTILARMTISNYDPVLTLPSGGDCGYPGLVWHDDTLWMSYYSSHEGKASIYLARIGLDQVD